MNTTSNSDNLKDYLVYLKLPVMRELRRRRRPLALIWSSSPT